MEQKRNDNQLLLSPLNVGEPFTNKVAQAQSPNETGNVDPMSLDHFLDMIGMKWYHIRLLLIVGTVAVSEGAQIIIVTLSVMLTESYWNFSDTVRTLLVTLTFAGVVLGSAMSGFFADKYGRKKPMLAAVICMTLFNLISAFSANVIMFGIIRTLVGVALGFFAPLGFTYVVENVPKNYRGQIVMLANACIFVGELIACFIASQTIENLSVGDWRALLGISTILFAISLLLCSFYLDESLRYMLVMGRFEAAFKLFDKILRVNKDARYPALTEGQKAALQAWEHHLEEEVTDRDIASFSALFKGQFRKLTLIIWFGWFVNFFIYYGILIFLPLTLAQMETPEELANAEGSEDLSRLTLSVLVESLSVVIAFVTINIKSISQRKTLIIFFLATGLSSLLMSFKLPVNMFVIFATITKICIDICMYYSYLFTLECYPTKYRATGLGLAIAVGKIATVLVPFTCYGLSEIYLFAPFAVFSLLCLAASGAVYKMPSDIEYRDLM